MGELTKIAWTDHTMNPWWGCQRVSPGCENCYAEAFSHRLGRDLWGPKAERKVASESYWDGPLKWNRAAAKAGVRRRVFCASMADVFEDRADLVPHRARLWELIRTTPHLDWLLLTKRPENLKRMIPWHTMIPGSPFGPWPNIWLGTTAEDQKRLDERAPLLLAVPAVVHFLSCEPLLEELDLTPFLAAESALDEKRWVIVGGESGSGARMFKPAWARSCVDQCRASGVACFVKQLGAKVYDRTVYEEENALDVDWFYWFKDSKASDPSEWPEDLRVREFPR